MKLENDIEYTWSNDELTPIDSVRLESREPFMYRQVQYPDGRLVLQGAYAWYAGTKKYGHNWKDLPVVHVDKQGMEVEKDVL